MADESDAGAAGLRELYADSDSGDDFVGFDAETARRAERTSTQSQTRRNDTDSSSDPESSDSGSESSDGDTGTGARQTTMPAAGNIRRGRGQIRGRGRGRNGDNLGPTASGSATPTVPTLADGTEIEWTADSGECGANWMQQLPNDLGKPAFFPTMNLRPIDFFLRTFPLALLTLLCAETNRYFAHWSRQPTMNDAIRKAWVDVDVPEMKALISLLIVMGLCRRFSYHSYWSTNWLLDMPGFRSILPRDRFFAILCFLHLSDNSSAIPRGQPGHDRAFKIRPMIRSLVEAWQDAYDLEKSVSVDECMIAFKGRVSMRQYMPKKPSKWGLKGWVLAGSDSGYAYNWMLYTGKENDRVAVGLGRSVVVSLTECLPAGHCVYYDNFFSSVELTLALENKGLGSCGTVRANRRGLPIQLKQFAKATKATMQRSSPLFLQSGNMLAIGWYDKRAVCLLTNIHVSSMVTKQRHGHPDFQKPTAIEAYNQKMGGVDLADQFNSYYALTKRSYKWWKKVFMHLLLTSVTNAYILHRSSEAELLTSSDFRLQLAEQLVEGYERRNVMRGRPSSSEETPLRLSGRHFLQHCGKSKPECVVCTKREGGKSVHRKRTSYSCKTCVPSVALCAVPCFEIYHTKRDYRAFYEQQL